MDTAIQFHQKIVIKIIKEQSLIIGPLAWDEARKVEGLTVTDHTEATITIEGASNAKNVIDQLVAQYQRIFGKASHEVCREAVRDIVAEMPKESVPESLK